MPIQMTIKSRGADIVRQGLEDLTTEVPKIGRKRIYEKLREAKSILATPAPRPTYPINWDSERQKRAFFATGGFGKGIPYTRRGTGGMAASWKLEREGEGWKLYNDQSAAVYVFGNYEGARQSNIHAGRHPLMQPTIEAKIQELPPDIEEHIGYYARQKGF